MSLTEQQAATLKTAILANPTWNAFPNDSDGNYALALRLSSPATPEVLVWNSRTPTDKIQNAIDGTKYTPNATVTGAEVEPLLGRKRAWMDEVNIKQMLLQTLIAFREFFNASLPTQRASLQDAVVQLPTGPIGGDGKPAMTTAGGHGGVNVLTACLRPALNVEVVFSGPPVATGPVSAPEVSREGGIDANDVQQARSA